MSRCFPYPPPGYVKNGIRDEALIESIKLQREGEKAKKERKKERKQEKKEKKKVLNSGEIVSKKHSKKHSHKKRHRDERTQEDREGKGLQKKTENETEQLEKSSITEERVHPVGSQNSFDSTLNSNKRQKLSSPPDDRHNSGSIIRIRLPVQRHEDPEVSPSKEQPCTVSGRTDEAQMMHEPVPSLGREGGEQCCSSSGKMTFPEPTLRVSEEKPCLFTGTRESSAQMAKTAIPSSLCGSCSPGFASNFRDVIENWVPSLLESDCSDLGDEQWLFETNQNHEYGAKMCKVSSLGLPHANSTTLPHVCYLPEADIYALPFTVPF